MTNCFRIDRLPTEAFTMYDVTFEKSDANAATQEPNNKRTDEEKRKKQKHKLELFHHLQTVVQPGVFRPRMLYDGGAIGFAHPLLAQALGGEQHFRVRLRDSGVPAQGAKFVTTIRLKVSKGVPITATEINDIVIKGHDSDRRSELLNFIQLLVRQASNNLHPNNGRAYFPEGSGATRQGLPRRTLRSFLELRSGIFHSVRPAGGNLVVVVDTTVSAFYQHGRLEDAVMQVLGAGNLIDLTRLDESAIRKLTKFFKGVCITEMKGNPPRKSGRRAIRGFDLDGAFFEFTNGDGHPTTIAQHYLQTHNITLRNPKWPGVIVRERGDYKEILPMELCEIVPHQLFKKALAPDVTREMVSLATLKPQEKISRIQEAAQHYQSSQEMTAAGMSVDVKPVMTPACSLPTPRIEFGQNDSVAVNDGKWNVVGKKLTKVASECHWAILNLAPLRIKTRMLLRQVETFQQCAQKLGLPLLNPLVVRECDSGGGSEHVIEALKNLMCAAATKYSALVSAVAKRQFFILCVLEQEASGARATIKHWGDVVCGVITQCVRANKLEGLKSSGQASQYWNNVVLKVNPRLGGENSTLSGSPAYQAVTTAAVTMIVGVDVGHPSPGVRKPSVASLVYNTNPTATIYNAITALQDPRTEVIADLFRMMCAAMNDVHAAARKPIQRIIFYRDGVSEGEYETIRQAEIADIKRAIDEVWATTGPIQEMAKQGKEPRKPTLTFIVVGKRHHTLLFPSNPSQGDKTGNCPAGVVVSEGITEPTIPNFYLLSHSAIMGTSRSSHYIVLHNEVFPGDTKILEELSYALCHVYAKATRSVSIPAPVYYADKVCIRDGFHFAPNVQDRLEASDAGSMANGGGNGPAPLNVEAWKKEFKDPHKNIRGSMYFL